MSSCSVLRAGQRGVCRGFRRNAEMLVEILRRRARAETVHADELSVLSEIARPAERRDRRFDGDLYRTRSQNGVTICCRLFLEQLPGRHGDDARGHALLRKQLARLHRNLNFRAGCKECDLGFAGRRYKLIAAARRQILIAMRRAQSR